MEGDGGHEIPCCMRSNRYRGDSGGIAKTKDAPTTRVVHENEDEREKERERTKEGIREGKAGMNGMRKLVKILPV